MLELKAIKPFKDKVTKATVNPGDVITASIERANNMVALGLCVITAIAVPSNENSKSDIITFKDKEYEVSAVKAALETIGATVAKNAAVPGVTKAIENLTEEQTEALNVELTKE